MGNKLSDVPRCRAPGARGILFALRGPISGCHTLFADGGCALRVSVCYGLAVVQNFFGGKLGQIGTDHLG